MKPFMRPTFFSAMFMLSLAAAATATDHGTCTDAVLVGTSGYTLTGSIIMPSGAVPFAAVGTGISDVDGNFEATQNSSMGGQISQDLLKGNWSQINPDCTVEFSAGIYSQSGQLLRTVYWAGVMIDNGNEFRGIMTKMELPNGVTVPAVVTMSSKRLFPAPGNSR